MKVWNGERYTGHIMKVDGLQEGESESRWRVRGMAVRYKREYNGKGKQGREGGGHELVGKKEVLKTREV